jgi:hypothetical protein
MRVSNETCKEWVAPLNSDTIPLIHHIVSTRYNYHASEQRKESIQIKTHEEHVETTNSERRDLVYAV